ncbi:MAG: hypothetical protein RL215_1469 [Planctomycetota bacterium]
MFPEFSSVVTGGDEFDVGGLCGGVECVAEGILDMVEGEAIDDDFVDGVAVSGEVGVDESAECGAPGFVGAGFEFGVAGADFASGADDATWEGESDAGLSLSGGGGEFCGSERGVGSGAADQEVSAGDGRGGGEFVFAEEFAIHDGDSPESFLVDFS